MFSNSLCKQASLASDGKSNANIIGDVELQCTSKFLSTDKCAYY